MELLVGVQNFKQLLEKPFVNLGQIVNPVNGVASLKGFLYHQDAFVGRGLERMVYVADVELFVAYKTMKTLTNHAQPFLDSFLKCAAYGHHFSYGFHGGAELVVHAMELA